MSNEPILLTTRVRPTRLLLGRVRVGDNLYPCVTVKRGKGRTDAWFTGPCGRLFHAVAMGKAKGRMPCRISPTAAVLV